MLLSSLINDILTQWDEMVAPKDATKISMALQQFMGDIELSNMANYKQAIIPVNENFIAELPPDMNLFGALWVGTCVCGEFYTIDITDKLCPPKTNCNPCMCDSCEVSCKDGYTACCSTCNNFVGYQWGQNVGFYGNGAWGGYYGFVNYDGSPLTPIGSVPHNNPFGTFQREPNSKFLYFSSLIKKNDIIVRYNPILDLASLEIPEEYSPAAMNYALWKVRLGKGDRQMANEFEQLYYTEKTKIEEKRFTNNLTADMFIRTYRRNEGVVLQNR